MHVRISARTAVLLAALLVVAAGVQAADSRCTMEGNRGPCKALLERYGYDSGSGTCKEIIWGGCGSPEPFETKEECLQVCGGSKPLVLSEVQALPGRTLPYVLVSVEYPKAWDQPDFTIRVNGQERPFRSWGGGFSREKYYGSYLIFPGATGLLQITVQATVNGQTFEAKDRLYWDRSAMVGLLDSPGRNEAVLREKPLRFWAFPVESVRVRFNGQPVTPTLEPLSGKPVGLFSLAPAWQPGTNTLTVETTGPDGKRATEDYTFVYLANKTVAVQDTLVLSFGRPASKSGPFSSLELVGNALGRVGRMRGEPYYALDEHGWLFEQTALVQTLRAERPGETIIRILMKPHFLQPVELERELRITVVPGARD